MTRSRRSPLTLGEVFGHGENVVPEIEALLCGGYVEYLERRGRHVPPWAWINLLAHGTEDALCSAARIRRRVFLEVNVWRLARGYLAGEVLDAAHRTGSLRAFQAAVLVPLELRQLATPPRRTRPGQWAAGVLAAIEDHPGVARRSPA